MQYSTQLNEAKCDQARERERKKRNKMLTGLKLGNFKAFGETQHIPIRPLTLIFGANSAGKSSIIQGLLLFHEVERNSTFSLHRSGISGESWTVSSGSFDITRPRLAGNLLDLGGFDSYVRCGRRNTNVALGIEFSLNDALVREELRNLELGEYEAARPNQFEAGELAKFLDGHSSIGVALEFGRKVPKLTYLSPQWNEARQGSFLAEKRVDESLVEAQAVTVQACEIRLDGEWVVRFERITDYSMELAAVNRKSRWVCDNLVYDLMDLRDPTAFANYEVVASLLPEHVRSKGGNLLRDPFTPPLAKLCSVLRRVASVACDGVEYLGGIRAIPPRYLGSSDDKDVNWGSTEKDAWRRLLRSPELLAKVNAWLETPSRLRVPVRLQINQLVDTELIKRAIQSPVGKQRRNQEATAKAIAHAVNEAMRSARPELTLVDHFTGASVSHRDVGLGISQILPVLVNAIGAEHSTFCIEQPELHLHPALQAELGDVFIESALGERKNVFLLETHSEHLILRILRRIRETTAGKPTGLPAIRPEDVAVLYVKPTDNGSVVTELPITPDGDFSEPWPDGFFPERAEELF